MPQWLQAGLPQSSLGQEADHESLCYACFGDRASATGQLGRLAQLTGLDLGRVRNHVGNLGPQVNFDRPEFSPCLTTFTAKSEPGYHEALAIIQVGKALLGQRPRADMPGFQPCLVDQHREDIYAAR